VQRIKQEPSRPGEAIGAQMKLQRLIPQAVQAVLPIHGWCFVVGRSYEAARIFAKQSSRTEVALNSRDQLLAPAYLASLTDGLDDT
jgi:hypothetical protein